MPNDARAAYDRLTKSANLLLFLAKNAAFPDPDERDSPEYLTQRVLDYAHQLVDEAHDLRHAILKESAT